MAVTADNKIQAPWAELYSSICFPSYQSFGFLPPVLPSEDEMKARVVTALESHVGDIDSQLLIAAFKSELALKGYSETGLFKRGTGDNTYIKPGARLDSLSERVLQNNDEVLLTLLSQGAPAISVEPVFNILTSLTERGQTSTKNLYLNALKSYSFYSDWELIFQYYTAIKSGEEVEDPYITIRYEKGPKQSERISTGALYLALINKDYRTVSTILGKNLPFSNAMLMHMFKELILTKQEGPALFVLGHPQLFRTPDGYPANVILELLVFAINQGSENIFYFILNNFPIHPTNQELDEWSWNAASPDYPHLYQALRHHFRTTIS